MSGILKERNKIPQGRNPEGKLMKSGLLYCVICIISCTKLLHVNKRFNIEKKTEVSNLSL